MKLKPFDPVLEALEIAGIAESNLQKTSQLSDPKASKIQKILDENGASIDEAAAAVGRILRNGEPNEVLRAANLAFQAHGVLKEAEKPSIPAINININSLGKEQKTLLQLVTPGANFIPEEIVN